MHLIVYTSEYVGTKLDADLQDIITAAKRNNSTVGVTGVMFSHQNRFLQFIEGEQADVTQLMSRIEKDARHTNLRRLFDESIPERGFASWNMDHFEIQPGTNLEVESLELIRNACKANFQSRTDVIVNIFKGFIASGMR